MYVRYLLNIKPRVQGEIPERLRGRPTVRSQKEGGDYYCADGLDSSEFDVRKRQNLTSDDVKSIPACTVRGKLFIMAVNSYHL